jgi:Hint domain
MGTSTTYTATGSNVQNGKFIDYIDNPGFIEVLGSFNASTSYYASTVTSFDAHLSAQSGADVLAMTNWTSTWNGTTYSFETINDKVYNITGGQSPALVGSYTFSNQDLAFTFASPTSNVTLVGAILQGVDYENTAIERSASSPVVSFSFNATGTVSAPSAQINVEAVQGGLPGPGTVFWAPEFIFTPASELYSTPPAITGVSTIDVHLSSQDGGASLFMANSTHNFGLVSGSINPIPIDTEIITVSSNNVYETPGLVAGGAFVASGPTTLIGTWSFSGQDLIFTFASSTTSFYAMNALLGSIEYQDTSGTHPAYTQEVSFTIPGYSSTPAAYDIFVSNSPPTVQDAVANITPDNVAAPTTYGGVPVAVMPNATITDASGGFFASGASTVFEPEVAGLTASVVNGGTDDILLFDPSAKTIDGVQFHATGGAGGSYSIYDGDQNVAQIVFDQTGPGAYRIDFNGVDVRENQSLLTYILRSIEYENTSASPPSSAEIAVQFVTSPQTSTAYPYIGWPEATDSTAANITVDIESTACYRRGTLIEIARGRQQKVEHLNIGDKVRTASGALRPIKWIGRRSYAGRFVMGRKDILPVCFKAGSLGANLPERDLWVSPNHAMYFKGNHPDGVLIEAKDLINGVSIVQAEHVETLEYFHIELDTHDVIIAEGALSETFIDDDSRAMFHNARDYATLYGEEDAAPAHYCAPRLSEGYEVEAVRERLAQRASLVHTADARHPSALRGFVDHVGLRRIKGWAQNIDAPEAPVCLDIFVDGKLIGRVLANAYREDLNAAGLGSGRHGFTFTPPAGAAFAPDAVQVRRSFDGAVLEFGARRGAA